MSHTEPPDLTSSTQPSALPLLVLVNTVMNDNSCLSQQANERQPCYAQDYCIQQEQTTGLENLLLGTKAPFYCSSRGILQKGTAGLRHSYLRSEVKSQTSVKHLLNSAAEDTQLINQQHSNRVPTQVSLPKVRQASLFCQLSRNRETVRGKTEGKVCPRSSGGINIKLQPAFLCTCSQTTKMHNSTQGICTDWPLSPQTLTRTVTSKEALPRFYS